MKCDPSPHHPLAIEQAREQTPSPINTYTARQPLLERAGRPLTSIPTMDPATREQRRHTLFGFGTVLLLQTVRYSFMGGSIFDVSQLFKAVITSLVVRFFVFPWFRRRPWAIYVWALLCAGFFAFVLVGWVLSMRGRRHLENRVVEA